MGISQTLNNLGNTLSSQIGDDAEVNNTLMGVVRSLARKLDAEKENDSTNKRRRTG